jgi:hypothetical protein
MKSGFTQITSQQGINEAKDDKGFDTDQDVEAENVNELNVDQVKDEFLTGYYVIGGIKYIYKQNTGIIQKLTMLRREWPSRINNLEG